MSGPIVLIIDDPRLAGDNSVCHKLGHADCVYKLLTIELICCPYKSRPGYVTP